MLPFLSMWSAPLSLSLSLLLSLSLSLFIRPRPPIATALSFVFLLSPMFQPQCVELFKTDFWVPFTVGPPSKLVHSGLFVRRLEYGIDSSVYFPEHKIQTFHRSSECDSPATLGPYNIDIQSSFILSCIVDEWILTLSLTPLFDCG